jgi:hypothetical protein
MPLPLAEARARCGLLPKLAAAGEVKEPARQQQGANPVFLLEALDSA